MNFFIRQLLKSVGVVVRSLKAVLVRRLTRIKSWFHNVLNISRGAGRMATSAVQSATEIAKKPSKREDYVSFGNLLIAKVFLLRAVLVLIALGAAVYFFAWPFLLSHFFTARFWVEDKRVETWTGRVAVFADKKKTVPLYTGRLEKGKLQGEGRLYTDGVLSYEGTFLDGLRSGMGTVYEEGELRYQGQFAQDVYEGTGTAYVDEDTTYEGQFSAGQYNGKGKLFQGEKLLYAGQFDNGIYQGQGSLYQGGVLVYEGAFQEGVPQGMGTSYYYGGGVRYQGQFENGVPEGTGKAYEDGRLIYQGGFSKGVYSGEGTLYPVQGQQIAAEFLEGTPQGVVRWSKGGKLYYEGEWAEERPEGYGILYAKSGEPAFKGTFTRGTIDGAALLGLPVDDLRKALGEDSTKSTAGSGTFAVSSPRLGLTAQCTYQSDSAPSQVAAVYLYAPQDGEGWFQLLPGMDRADRPSGESRTLSYTRQDDVPLASGQYESVVSVTSAVLYQRQAPVLVRWTGGGSGAGAGGADGSGGAGADSAGTGVEEGLAALAAGVTGMDAVEDLLASLDGMESVPAADAAAVSGDEPVGTALSACENMDAASALLTALSDYWYQAEAESLLAENLSRTRALLDDARRDASMGQGGSTAAAREETVRTLEEQILNCQLEKKKAEVAAKSAGGEDVDPSKLNLGETAALFDPSGLDAGELPLVAAAYAQAVGDTTDAAALETSVKSSLLSLQQSFTAAQTAIRQYDAAAQAADSAAAQYAMGTGTKAAWYDALSAKNNVRANLYSSMNTFTKQAAELNRMTGGWVSRSMGWHAEEFAQVVEAQFPEGIPPLEPSTDSGQGASSQADGQGAASQTGGQTADSTGGRAGTSGNAGENIYAGEYPDWYNEAVEPVENEPGLPRTDTGTDTSGGGTDTSGTSGGGTDTSGTSGGGTDTSGTSGGGTDTSGATGGGTDTSGTSGGGTDSSGATGGGTGASSTTGGGTDSSGAVGGGTGASSTTGGGTDSSGATGGGTGASSTTGGGTGASSTTAGGTDASSTFKGEFATPEDEFRSVMTPEQWDALWGVPEDA